MLSRRAFHFWSPRKRRASLLYPSPPSAGASAAHAGHDLTARGQHQQGDPPGGAPQLGPSQVGRLTRDFERALALQQQSTLQLIQRHEQLIGDLATLVRILQERVLVQQQQLDLLGAPSAAQDPGLNELERLLPFGKLTMEQMLQLSDRLNERLHRPPFVPPAERSPASPITEETPS